MRKKALLLALVFISFFSCDKIEQIEKPVAEDPIEDSMMEDVAKPELTVIGFTDIVETITDISISVVDEANTETKIMHNGEELSSSNDKQFTFSLNPYGLKVGETEFTIVSTDDNGNESSEIFFVEIKHLLMTYGFSAQESESQFQTWVFFNTIDGEELTVFKPTVGDSKIYTDSIIANNRILISSAQYIAQEFTGGGGYKNLLVSTYEIPLGGARKVMPVSDLPVEKSSTLNLTMKDIPFENSTPQYSALGSNYFSNLYDGNAEESTMVISHNANGPIFIRTNSWGSIPNFDGKKENYKYTKLNPTAGISDLIVQANDFVAADSYVKIDIPEHDLGTFILTRRNYEENDNGEFIYHDIYDTNFRNATEPIDYIDLPVFESLNNYDNSIQYTKNGNRFYSKTNDDNIDLTMPNWSATTSLKMNTIELEANNGVDYYIVNLKKSDNSGDTVINFNWSFSTTVQNGLKVIPRLGLPQIIYETFADAYFETTDDLELVGTTAVNYLNYNSYGEIVDWKVFNTDSPTDVDQYQLVTFPNPSSSGKFYKDNIIWDTDTFNRYGFNEKAQVTKRR